MSFLLHTDTAASIIRGNRPTNARFTQASPRPCLSVVSVTGLEIWLLRRRTPVRYQQAFFHVQQILTLLDVTEPVAHRAALIDRHHRRHGQNIGLADALIAGTAVEHGLTLVTHSLHRFTGIPGLTVIDWAAP